MTKTPTNFISITEAIKLYTASLQKCPKPNNVAFQNMIEDCNYIKERNAQKQAKQKQPNNEGPKYNNHELVMAFADQNNYLYFCEKTSPEGLPEPVTVKVGKIKVSVRESFLNKTDVKINHKDEDIHDLSSGVVTTRYNHNKELERKRGEGLLSPNSNSAHSAQSAHDRARVVHTKTYSQASSSNNRTQRLAKKDPVHGPKVSSRSCGEIETTSTRPKFTEKTINTSRSDSELIKKSGPTKSGLLGDRPTDLLTAEEDLTGCSGDSISQAAGKNQPGSKKPSRPSSTTISQNNMYMNNSMNVNMNANMNLNFNNQHQTGYIPQPTQPIFFEGTQPFDGLYVPDYYAGGDAYNPYSTQLIQPVPPTFYSNPATVYHGNYSMPSSDSLGNFEITTTDSSRKSSSRSDNNKKEDSTSNSQNEANSSSEKKEKVSECTSPTSFDSRVSSSYSSHSLKENSTEPTASEPRTQKKFEKRPSFALKIEPAKDDQDYERKVNRPIKFKKSLNNLTNLSEKFKDKKLPAPFVSNKRVPLGEIKK